MIKKFTLLLLVALSLATTAKAKTVETSLWNGTYTDGVELNNETVATFKAGDVLRVYVTVPEGGANFKIVYKGAPAWTETTIPSINNQFPWVNYGDTYKDFMLTDADITALDGKNIYIYKGDNSTIDKVSLITEATASGTTNIYTGSHDLASWNGLQLTTNDYKNKLATAKIGDVLRVTYTSDEAGQINFCNSSYAGFEGGSNSVVVTVSAATVEFEITTGSVLESIQGNGVVINGQNALISAVDLLTYADSYDAVSITVGSDGVATYSNGGKNVQISACDALKAYYASAVAKGIVTLTELTECIPANTGVIVYGSEGTYTVPVGDDGLPSITTNYLKPTGDSSAEVAASTSGTFHYIFAKDNTNGEIGFYKLAEDYSRVTTEKEGDNEIGTTVYYHRLAAHKAYLETTTDYTPDPPASPKFAGSRALLRLSFGGGEGTTAINTALKNPIVEDGLYYTLQGVAVKNPSKGIYILNGKKVFVK